jgi:large subunit ribosomal protein L9
LKVILTRDYEKLGNAGDVINVKDGFAKNFLIPNNIALVATQGNLNQMEIVKKSLIKKEAKSIEEAKNIAAIIDGMTINIKVNSSPEGKLYGSITTKDIAEKILELKKVELDKKKIDLEDHIKEVGSYEVIARLYKEIKAAIKLEVTSDDVVVQEVQKEADTEEMPEEV